ncbi:MAG TPA: hypothetical protein VKA04_11100 [Pseudodesulfovibrio sp.]|nr:hypothetical protein [Pseudodesulfovibrio sp.]
MKRYLNLTVGLGLSGATLAILALLAIVAGVRNPDYTVARQVVMGWPLIVLGLGSFTAGLRVAFWPEARRAEVEEHKPEAPTFRAAA